MTWQPLLVGHDRDAAVRALGAIAVGIDTTGPDFSLASGQAGVALFLAYVSELEGRAPDAEVAVRLVEKAMSAALANAGTSLYSGLIGPAWVLAHLDGWLLDVGDDDPNDVIDGALWTFLARTPRTHEFDLISGLTGMGMYALGRLPRPEAQRCLESVIGQLSEAAERGRDGITWFTPPDLVPPSQRREAPRGYYNLGVAHGVPGVIALLAAATAAGVAESIAAPLLHGAVDWLLAQRSTDCRGAVFPNWVGPHIQPIGAGSAWCYGDPGVAAVLMAAAAVSREDSWAREARDVALRAAARSAHRMPAVEIGLCHGTAGLAHMYNRLWQATGEPALRSAALSWLARTGQLLPHVDDPSFLEGLAGVGLVLLAAIGVEPRWDTLMAVSSPS